MRLSTKLTVTLGAGAALVLTGKALLDVQRERALFDQEAVREEQLLGTALAATIAEVWKLEGEARALELVDSANTDDELRVRWVWLDAIVERRGATVGAPSGGEVVELAAESRALLQQGKSVSRKDPTLGPHGQIVRYVPVDYGAARRGALEVTKSLESENAYIRNSLSRTITATVVLIVLFVGMSALFSAWFIARPVGLLVEQFRRIGSGDLSRRLELTRSDEFAVLGGEVNAMATQLRHADRLTTVGTVAAGLAHELGTPLHVVNSSARSIATEELSAKETKESANVIAEQSQRMIAIIRNLLDFARRRELKRESYDMRHVVEQSVTLLQPVINKRKQRVVVDAPKEELNAKVDLTQLQQALTNLVVNASYAEPEGGDIAIEVRKLRAQAPVESGGQVADYVRIAVKDHGPGFTDEVKAKLFEPFFTTRRVGEGTGLGLPIASAIVREHDGFIGVETELGKGSCFSIFVPAEVA
ncbi:MAG: HAMP domain-containing histidine kinase [Myxococcaceae bacterium]|nr:HAMP domain-containing histidine kinase [Myxococcaceae bacterium]